MGQFATRWRGTAEIEIVVYGGSLDGGRLRVFWSPDRGDVAGKLSSMQYHGFTLDLAGGTARGKMVIPMATGSPTLRMPHGIAFVPYTQYSVAPVDMCNGQVHVHVENPLVTGRSPDAVQVVAYIRWPQLEFFGFTTGLVTDVVATADDAVVRVPEIGLSPLSSATTPLLHLRPALVNYWQTATVRISASSGRFVGSWTFPLPMTVTNNAYPAPGLAKPPQSLRAWPSAVDFVFKSYSVWRGGVKIRVLRESTSQDGIGPNSHAWLASWASGEWTSKYTYGRGGMYNAFTVQETVTGGVMDPMYWSAVVLVQRNAFSGITRGSIQSGSLLGLRVPWDWSWPWRLSAASSTFGIPTVTSASTTGSSCTFCFTDQAVADMSGCTYTFYQGFDDDVVFHGFVCMPVWTAAGATYPLT